MSAKKKGLLASSLMDVLQPEQIEEEIKRKKKEYLSGLTQLFVSLVKKNEKLIKDDIYYH